MWTDGQIAEIRGHIERGLSRAVVAEIFGSTRNAIIGLCYRKGITGPNNQIIGAMVANDRKRRANALRSSKRDEVQPITTRDRWRKKARVAQLKEPELPFCPDEPIPLRTTVLSSVMGCQWVCGGTDDNCLPEHCGHETVKESSWCAHHYRRVYA